MNKKLYIKKNIHRKEVDMARDKKIDRRLVGNYDKQDKQFYFLVQKWNGETYETVSTFEAERCEVNGLKDQYKDR